MSDRLLSGASQSTGSVCQNTNGLFPAYFNTALADQKPVVTHQEEDTSWCITTHGDADLNVCSTQARFFNQTKAGKDNHCDPAGHNSMLNLPKKPFLDKYFASCRLKTLSNQANKPSTAGLLSSVEDTSGINFQGKWLHGSHRLFSRLQLYTSTHLHLPIPGTCWSSGRWHVNESLPAHLLNIVQSALSLKETLKLKM